MRARKRYAREAALQLLKKHNMPPPPDVVELARLEGLDVKFLSGPSELSGMLAASTDGGYILVNDDHVPERKRFTIAHELGHFMLHKVDGRKILFRDDRSSAGTNPQEVEANNFAAELLMPAHAIRDAAGHLRLSPMDTKAIDELAAQYKVSSHAMAIRLDNLGILKIDYW